MAINKVLVVGAGPSGLLLATLLAKRGIAVEVLEQNHDLDPLPRATHYAPPAVYELRRAGILDQLREEGFEPSGVCWRKPDGTYIAGLDNNDMVSIDRMVCIPLQRVSQILYQHLIKYDHASVKYGHKVLSLGQDENKAWVEVEVENEGKKTFSADYIVGCDGANSQIRRSLFGDWNFPGWTWDEQIVATNVYYDFKKFGYEDDSNFIVHKDDYFMAAKISRDGMYRVTYGDVAGLTREELIARQPARFEKMLPGHPKPDQYKLANISPYKIHQRLAEKMRVGRFMLAADAAHLCNPFGGMGLTGGIVDVGNLYDCFVGIHEGKLDDSILDKWNDVRSEKFRTLSDPISTENLKRLWKDPETVGDEDEFLLALKRTAVDKDFAREFQKGIYALQHDFTQYYTEPEPEADPEVARYKAQIDAGPAADYVKITTAVK